MTPARNLERTPACPDAQSNLFAGEAWRSQEAQPLPPVPNHLKGVARQVYIEIVEHYPPERFMGGANLILEQFAHASAELRRLTPKMREVEPGTPAYSRITRQVTAFSQIQLSSAVRLRLTPSTTYRAESGRLDERRPPQSALLGIRN